MIIRPHTHFSDIETIDAAIIIDFHHIGISKIDSIVEYFLKSGNIAVYRNFNYNTYTTQISSNNPMRVLQKDIERFLSKLDYRMFETKYFKNIPPKF